MLYYFYFLWVYISFSQTIQNRDVIINSSLSLKSHINAGYKSIFLELSGSVTSDSSCQFLPPKVHVLCCPGWITATLYLLIFLTAYVVKRLSYKNNTACIVF